MCVRDHEASAGAQNARELRQYRGQVGDVCEGERAHDGVDRVVGKRQPVQVGLVEVDIRQAPAGLGEHVR
ncbi:hypothetical protein SAFG77S_02722 [Streptomyces afghaniensis]